MQKTTNSPFHMEIETFEAKKQPWWMRLIGEFIVFNLVYLVIVVLNHGPNWAAFGFGTLTVLLFEIKTKQD